MPISIYGIKNSDTTNKARGLARRTRRGLQLPSRQNRRRRHMKGLDERKALALI
jgi:hypothetical protein